MTTSRTPIFRRLFLIIPVFTVSFWFFAQKGCELTPNASPTRALAESGSQPSKRRRSTAALVPPNPKELDIAYVIGAVRAFQGT